MVVYHLCNVALNLLPAPGFELLIIRLMSSCRGMDFHLSHRSLCPYWKPVLKGPKSCHLNSPKGHQLHPEPHYPIEQLLHLQPWATRDTYLSLLCVPEPDLGQFLIPNSLPVTFQQFFFKWMLFVRFYRSSKMSSLFVKTVPMLRLVRLKLHRWAFFKEVWKFASQWLTN